MCSSSNTPKAGAVKYARRIKDVIERHRFVHGPLTVSVGIAALPEDATHSADLVPAADRALYAAKRLGPQSHRSRVGLLGRARAPSSLAAVYSGHGQRGTRAWARRPRATDVPQTPGTSEGCPELDLPVRSPGRMTHLEALERIQQRVLWLSAWMVHHANARPERRRPQGRRPSGLVGVGGQPADRALLRRATLR